jgi:hypothetical protein
MGGILHHPEGRCGVKSGRRENQQPGSARRKAAEIAACWKIRDAADNANHGDWRRIARLRERLRRRAQERGEA